MNTSALSSPIVGVPGPPWFMAAQQQSGSSQHNTSAVRCNWEFSTCCNVQVQAEKTAWDYVKQHNIDLVVINPSFVFGPTISKRIDGESAKAMVVRDRIWKQGTVL